MPRRRKAHELTTEQVMRRVFPAKVRKELKQVAEQSGDPKKSRNSQSRKSMKG